MSIDFNKLYPGGGYYDNDHTPWGMCEKCGSYLHNFGVEYDPEEMQSFEPLICPNCQEVVKRHNHRWHAPNGLTFDYSSKQAFIEYLEATGDPLPPCIQEDLAWAAHDCSDDESEDFKAAWEHDEP
jgi:hypothetical protein